MHAAGLEWAFRLAQEPRRLFRRYFTDLWVFGRAILCQWWQLRSIRSQARKTNHVLSATLKNRIMEVVRFPERIDAATVNEHMNLWPRLAEGSAHLLLDLSAVKFIDSTGVGLLVRLQKELRGAGRQLVLVAPTKSISRALELMRFTDFFPIALDLAAARDLVQARRSERNVLPTLNFAGGEEPMAWQGDIVAANEGDVWRVTMMQLELAAGREGGLSINLAGVRFIDSAGIGLMVRVRKEGRQRGVPVRFTEPQAAVLNVLRILRMEKYLLN
jgi:anti-sigma B factor antagonist